MARSLLRFTANFLVYIAIAMITVFGFPKFLAWYLETPYPMAAITSGSMWPTLKEGDLVFIQGVKHSELKSGDVVVYRNTESNTFTIHRIAALYENELVTKGDANFSEDDPIPYDAIVGRAYRLGGHHVRIPHLGAITVFASKVRK